MKVAINNSLYQQAEIYAQQQGLILTDVIESFLERFIAKSKHITEQPVPDLVLSLLGAGLPVADDDLNGREAYYTAHKAKADAIITRNGKDFTPSKLPVMTAGEFLASIE